MSLEPEPTRVDGQLYVVRVWFERDGTRRVWRASLLRDREVRRYFSSPSALLAFLGADLPEDDVQPVRNDTP